MSIRARKLALQYASKLSPTEDLTTFTVEIWGHPNRPYTKADKQNPMACRGWFDAVATDERPAYQIMHEQASDVKQIVGGFTDTNGVDRKITAAYDPRDAWYWAALSYDESNGQMRFYTMGAADVSLTLAGSENFTTPYPTPRNTATEVAMGAGIDSAVAPVVADYDLEEFRLWSTVRTPTELLDNAKARIITKTGLSAYYPLDDGRGGRYHTEAQDLAAPQDYYPCTLHNNMAWGPPPPALHYHPWKVGGSVISVVDYVEDARASIVSAPTEEAQYPPTNMRHYAVEKAYRCEDRSAGQPWWDPLDIDIDLGARRPVRYIGILNHNIQSFGTITLLGSNDAFSTTPFSQGLPYRPDDLRFIFQRTQMYRYWRLRIEDLFFYFDLDDYLRIGKIRLGPVWVTRTHAERSIALGMQSHTVGGEAESGQRFIADEAPSRRTLDFRFPHISDVEMAEWRKWERWGQGARMCEVMLAPDHDMRGPSLYGRVADSLTISPRDGRRKHWRSGPITILADEPLRTDRFAGNVLL